MVRHGQQHLPSLFHIQLEQYQAAGADCLQEVQIPSSALSNVSGELLHPIFQACRTARRRAVAITKTSGVDMSSEQQGTKCVFAHEQTAVLTYDALCCPCSVVLQWVRCFTIARNRNISTSLAIWMHHQQVETHGCPWTSMTITPYNSAQLHSTA